MLMGLSNTLASAGVVALLCLAPTLSLAQTAKPPRPPDADLAAAPGEWDARFGTRGLEHDSGFMETYAIAIDGGDIYVGGATTSVAGQLVSKIAKWNGTNWSDMAGGLTGNVVRGIAVVGTNVYVGGVFTTAGGVPVSHAAKWDGSGWSALGTGLDGYVTAVAKHGTDVYFAGLFFNAGGQPAYGLARWNGTQWSSMGLAYGSYLNRLAFVGDDLYVSGTIVGLTGCPEAGCPLAKWNGATWTGISSIGEYGGGNIETMASDGIDLYVGGRLWGPQGFGAHVLRWNGSSWSFLGSRFTYPANTAATPNVFALGVFGGSLFAAGFFGAAGGVTADAIATWTGSSWAPVGASVVGFPVSSSHYAMAVTGDALYMTGSFTLSGTGGNSPRLGKWDGSSWSSIGSTPALGADGPIYGLATSGTDVHAGGNFVTAGGVAQFVAKWTGSSWSSVGGGTNGPVRALVVNGSDLYAGGDFTVAGTTPINYVARWNGSAWSALGTGIDFGPRAMVFSNGELYAGGWSSMCVRNNSYAFNCIGIAKWDGASWTVLAEGVGSADSVTSMIAIGSDVYVGGALTSIGGVTVNGLARWNGSTWSAVDGGLIGEGGQAPLVRALAKHGTDLFVGGFFSGAGNITARNLARWNGSNWSAVGGGVGTSGDAVSSLAFDGPDLYVGGSFNSISGETVRHIAKWSGGSWHTLGSGLGPVLSGVDVLAVTNDGVFAGGNFTTAGDQPSLRFARWIPGVPPTVVSHPQSQTIAPGGTAVLSVSVSGPAPLGYQWFTGSSGNTTSPLSGATASTYTTPQLDATRRYWVRISNAYGTANSNTATLAVSFTDPDLSVGTTITRAVHIRQLRTRVDMLRARYGLPTVAWSDGSLTEGSSLIRGAHIVELRTALAQVYAAANIPLNSFTDPVLDGLLMKAVHVRELRAAILAIE